MARRTRAAPLETRTSRLKLPIAKKPIFVKIGPGASLGYRRNQTVGTWVLRVADGKRGNWTKSIGAADDFADADISGRPRTELGPLRAPHATVTVPAIH
jgi:hypothetical protein